MTEHSPYGFSPHQKKALEAMRCLHCGDPMIVAGRGLSCVTCLREYPVDADGIVDAVGRLERPLTLAQRSGQWRLSARIYERFWRTRALSLLSGVTFPPELEIEVVARTVEVDHVDLLLDNACGHAFYGRALAEKFRRLESEAVVIANDLSLPMLRAALGSARREGVADRILFVRSDSERMPFAHKAFDAITCGGSFNEFSDPSAYLAEVARVLRSDGRMSLMCQVLAPGRAGSAVQRMLGRISGLRFPSSEELLEMLGAELSVEAVLHVGAVVLAKLRPHETSTHGDSRPTIVNPKDLTISAPISRN